MKCIKRCIWKLYFAFCKLVLALYKPHRCREPKYNISICAIFRNEAPYFREWLEFYKLIGVDHFYLYNNNSTDQYLKVLEPYIADGTVELIDWPEAHAQIAAYRNCIERFSADSKWIGFIDLDEFVVPKFDHSLPEFLKRFERRPAVLIYWRMFGASGRTERNFDGGLVTEDFVTCWEKYTSTGKCFYNTAYRFAFESEKNCILMHLLWTKVGALLMPPVNVFDHFSLGAWNVADSEKFPIQINHYVVKSFSEYQMRMKRGDVLEQINPRNTQTFLYHDMLCTGVDYAAYKYLVPLKLALRGETIGIVADKTKI